MLNGEDIRKKRESLDLTAGQLADLLGVKRANLYKWEKGHKPTDPEDYLKLEKWLNGEVESVPTTGDNKGTSFTAPAIVKQIAADPNLYERLLEEKERSRTRAEKQADEYLQIIKDNLTALLISSNAARQDLAKILLVNRVDDGKIMDNQDIAAGREPGSSAKEAGMLEVVTEMAALEENRKDAGKGKNVKAHK